ncbi:outer membrane beta-barrel protein [Sphingomonas bacterium]|uniref:outer membrane beta-barrel protein n=1 Tax=Sphingomonas bacterium TaxID=1895847 RepID=UPI00157690E9|nr:outer membrane beta-barrel protein [Sphingomonas bacterium]
MSGQVRRGALRRACVISALLCGASSARAQQAALPVVEPVLGPATDSGMTLDVARRIRPELEPVPISVGAIDIVPSLGLRGGYDSNLYAEQTAVRGEPYLQVEPGVSLRSDIDKAVIRVEATGRFARFNNQPEAAEDSYSLSASGRYAVTSQVAAEAGAQVAQLIERRDSSGFPGGRVAPVRFVESTVYGRAFLDSGAMRGFASLDVTRFDFRDTRALDATGRAIGPIDQDIRDNRVIRGSARLERRIGPALGVFVQGIVSSIDYARAQVAPGVLNFTGKSYTGLVGVAFRPGNLVEGTVGVGYFSRSYDAAVLRPIRGVAVDAELKYYLTPLVTLTGAASRSVEEAILQNRSSGLVSTRGSVRADYELLRPLIISAGGDYYVNAFRLYPRRDKVTAAFVNARYSLSRNLTVDADVRYDRRAVDNDPLTASFTAVVGSLGLRYAL